MALLVLVAHSGRTLQLDVQPSTRVDAVQHALVSFTGIPVVDQIAMYQGARLDPAKLLGAYRLPVDPAVASLEDHPVFLYCRSYLKPGAALPPPEALPPPHVQVPPLAEVNMAHPLHSAPSPLVRALPDYERHFQHHLATTRAYWEVAQKRLDRCRQLLSEQEVQARAADAARANVEAHYNYILNSYQTFLDKYNAQHATHATLLATFPSDLAALEAIELHPSLQQPASYQPQQPRHEPGPAQQPPGVGGGAAALSGAAPAPAPRRLADLYPVQRLREWAETCSRSHASFGAKVSELEALFQLLRKDVEGLFMQAPSVDLDALGRQMAEHEALLDEHSSMVQVLSKDLRTVRTLVEDLVQQLGSTAGGGGGGGGTGGGLRQGALHDAAAAMEAIHETHRNRVLPRLAQLDGQLAAFAARVEASKVAMSRDVVLQLQRISGQQSRIRDMKNKLAAFHEVLGRQDAAFAELRVVHRLPSAYRALLAEVVRRTAWHQLYCGQAGRLAEHMARFRDKEAGRRSVFASQVARYMPSDLLSRAGLAAEPPHCAVTVPAPEVPLITVSVSDLQRLSYLDERLLAASASLPASAAASLSAATSLHHHHHHYHHANRACTMDLLGPGLQQPHSHPHHHHHHHHHQHAQQQQHPQAVSRLAGTASMVFPGTIAVLDADPAPPTDSVNALEMENARLRAELANHIAAACIRELTATSTTASAGGEGQQPTTTAATEEAVTTGGSTPPAAARQARVSGGGGGGASPPAAVRAGAAGGPVAGTGGSPPPPPPPRRDTADLVTAMQRALGMKDDLIRHQQREVAALAARAASYEERILALEALLHQRAKDRDGGGGEADAAAADGQGLSRSGSREASAAEAAESTQPGVRGREGGRAERQRGAGPAAAADAEPAAAAAAATAVVERDPSGGKVRQDGEEGRRLSGQVQCGPEVGGAAAGEGGPGARRGGPEATGTAAAPAGPHEGEAAASPEGGAAAGPPPPQRTSALRFDAADTERSGVAGGAGCVLSPFSLQAAQQPEHVHDEGRGGVAAGARRPSATCGVGGGLDGGSARREDTSEAATAPPPPPLMARGGSRAVSGTASRRGSSGPQAIPQCPAGMRRGGGAAAAGDEADLPCEPRAVPMAIGSLPFATSLPAGSVLTSRLASSPSLGGGGGGIGLGLALGFGLAALAEGPLRSGDTSGQQGQGSRSSSSGSGSSSGVSDGRRLSGDGGGGEEDPGSDGVRTPGSRDGGSASSGDSSSGSGELQFMPSWSAPVSGDSANAEASGGATAPNAPEDGVTADGAAAVGLGAADGLSGGGGGGDGGDGCPTMLDGAAGGAAARVPPPADGTPVSAEDGAAAAAEVTAAAACASAAAAAADDVSEDDGGLAEDVPDIDEVFDSDGAWEVAPAEAEAEAAVEAVAFEAQARDRDTAGVGSSGPIVGGGGRGSGSGVGEGEGEGEAQQSVMEASSGYESVGSLVLDADA